MQKMNRKYLFSEQNREDFLKHWKSEESKKGKQFFFYTKDDCIVQCIVEIYQRQQNMSDLKGEYLLLNIMFNHNSLDAVTKLKGFELLIPRS